MSDFETRLQALVGRRLAEPTPGPDPVNVPMIRHWVEAMGDDRPILLDDDAARATGRDGQVAPATMIQAWTMRGYAATVDPPPQPETVAEMNALLEEGGYTSVVATDSAYDFHRELHPGDEITVVEEIESISDEKRTALGAGRFVTSLRTYTDQRGEVVATQRWRLLRFRPPSADGDGQKGGARDAQAGDAAASATDPSSGDDAPRRPRPAINRDNAFWFEAARQRRLVIQRCTACQQLRHPPMPGCPSCGSFDWDVVEASGRGTIHSFVVAHHPRIPGFAYPHVVLLVELEEGVRLLADAARMAPDDVEIGAEVELEWLDLDDELTLPAFRPVTKVS